MKHTNFIKRTKKEHRFDGIDLSRNEPAYGKYKDYPDDLLLTETLAKVKGVEEENIIPVRGAEEGIRLVFETFLSKRDRVIRPEPTYGMLDVFEQMRQARTDKVLYNKFYMKDELEKVMSKKHDILYLANPDNPTGTFIEDIDTLIWNADLYNIIVVLDLVYIYYAIGIDEMKTYEKRLLDSHDNLIIVNSFSKSHGLAGLRSGYIMGSSKLIYQIKERVPSNQMNSIAIKETINSLTDTTVLQKNIDNVNKWKGKFYSEFKYCRTTNTNFIILRIDEGELRRKCIVELSKQNIRIREYNEGLLRNSIRISIGSDDIMKKVFKSLKGVLS